MLIQIKVYMIAVIYIFGALYMILFPPRNYAKSGSIMKRVKRMEGKLQYTQYVDQKLLTSVTENMSKEDSEIVRVVHLTPRTAENNSIVALELHSDPNSMKPGILVIGALNAMTWGAPNAILDLAEKLLYDSNYQTPFFNDYDWYLIPLANPDGLNFTQIIRLRQPLSTSEWSRNMTARSRTRPKEWYKNIDRESDQDICFGTNINRNFAYHWQDDVFKTPDRCSQYYPGTKPFSTMEAQAIRAYIHKLGDSIHLAIYLHASFIPKKECILYPWRYSTRQPSNYRTLQAIGEYAARQARLPDGRLYEVHQASADEKVAGSFIDYISGVVGTELVFLVKPYHQLFPNYTDTAILETYVNKGISTILSIVRGWRSSTKQNTLSFFGKDIEF
ncbi:carboxypeptidase B-like [Epargyreus clarus]|uniref:carboxypeptidase B-like n=1 Tax=Epargyreus clarus TaxID=520877 RepID=UPI003C2BD20B